MNFYLSGSWARRAELQGYAAQLEELGHDNVSSWLGPSEFEERDHALTATVSGNLAGPGRRRRCHLANIGRHSG